MDILSTRRLDDRSRDWSLPFSLKRLLRRTVLSWLGRGCSELSRLEDQIGHRSPTLDLPLAMSLTAVAE